MDYPNNTMESRKQKHLNFEERMLIQLRLKDGDSAYKIAKELNRPINTVLNEISRGTVTQKKQGQEIQCYLADTGQATYNRNRKHCCRSFKRLTCDAFITHVCHEMRTNDRSVDSVIGQCILHNKFPRSLMVCTRTFYTYIDLGLLSITNLDLPLKLRRNTKGVRVRKHKKKLGTSIEERPQSVEERKEFGHWEIDTVIGLKSKEDSVLLTLVERQTRHLIVKKIPEKTAIAVQQGLAEIGTFFGSRKAEIFRTITSDNGLEFAELSSLEKLWGTSVYFAHPYASYERGTNERHNGLIRRFIPKGSSVNQFDIEQIAIIEEWCNTLPRKILGYHTPEELFEQQLDTIYAA